MRPQSALKFRLGEIIRDDYEPGLHLKTPFINNVVKFDKRLITLDMPPEQMNTAEQKFVEVDYYVKWRITDPSRFYTSTVGRRLRDRAIAPGAAVPQRPAR